MASTSVLVLGLDPASIPGYDPEPVLAYLHSHPAWLKLSGGGKTQGQAALDTVLAGRFASGPFRVSKRTAFLTARR